MTGGMVSVFFGVRVCTSVCCSLSVVCCVPCVISYVMSCVVCASHDILYVLHDVYPIDAFFICDSVVYVSYCVACRCVCVMLDTLCM